MKMLPSAGAASLTDFRIFETSRFQDDLKQDFGGQRDRVIRKLHTYVYPQLRANPYVGKNIKKLRGQPEAWRYRIGDYRFFYIVIGHERVVMMTAADVRGRAY